jgi:hypothetical protein
MASRVVNMDYDLNCKLVVVMFRSHCHWNCQAQLLFWNVYLYIRYIFKLAKFLGSVLTDPDQ